MSKQDTKAAISFFSNCWHGKRVVDVEAVAQSEKQWTEDYLARPWLHEEGDDQDNFYPWVVDEYGND